MDDYHHKIVNVVQIKTLLISVEFVKSEYVIFKMYIILLNIFQHFFFQIIKCIKNVYIINKKNYA